jgi:hypothetical protein
MEMLIDNFRAGLTSGPQQDAARPVRSFQKTDISRPSVNQYMRSVFVHRNLDSRAERPGFTIFAEGVSAAFRAAVFFEVGNRLILSIRADFDCCLTKGTGIPPTGPSNLSRV